jgi:hypothetical protein
MKRIDFVIASAALVVFSVSVGHAAPKAKDDSPATQARVVFENVDAWSGSIANMAEQLQMFPKGDKDSPTPFEWLYTMKNDVNNIGRELRSVEAERGSLDEWENKAFDEILPLMEEIAANTQKTILTYASDRNRLWATSFYEDAAKVFNEAQEVKGLLDGYLKLASVHQQEQRLESKVAELSGAR